MTKKYDLINLNSFLYMVDKEAECPKNTCEGLLPLLGLVGFGWLLGRGCSFIPTLYATGL